jgi:hypothetical protein
MSCVGTEKYLTVKEAALKIGVKEWQLHRAIAKGLVPAYTFATGRKLVLESEIRAFILRSRIGGVS